MEKRKYEKKNKWEDGQTVLVLGFSLKLQLMQVRCLFFDLFTQTERDAAGYQVG